MIVRWTNTLVRLKIFIGRHSQSRDAKPFVLCFLYSAIVVLFLNIQILRFDRTYMLMTFWICLLVIWICFVLGTTRQFWAIKITFFMHETFLMSKIDVLSVEITCIRFESRQVNCEKFTNIKKKLSGHSLHKFGMKYHDLGPFFFEKKQMKSWKGGSNPTFELGFQRIPLFFIKNR